jgi:hypothetical protein
VPNTPPKYNLNHTVPCTTYTNTNVVQTTISAADRGDVRPACELLYAHYGSRQQGQDVTWTEKYRNLCQ